MRTLSAAFAITIIASAGPLFAQQTSTPPPPPLEAEGVTLTPFVDIGFSGDLENSPAGFGAALGYGLSSRLALEADFSFTPDADQGFVGEVDSTVWSLSGNVLYHFQAERFVPYVAVGLGVLGAHTNAEDLGLEDDTSYHFGWNWGGGIKTGWSERFGFRGDLRYFSGDDLAPDHWRLYGGVVIRRIGR